MRQRWEFKRQWFPDCVQYKEVLDLSLAQLLDGFVIRRALNSAVPAKVVIVAVAILSAIETLKFSGKTTLRSFPTSGSLLTTAATL